MPDQVRVDVDGELQLRESTAHAAAQLDHLEDVDLAAGTIAATRARAIAPRVSGYLASTIKPAAGGLVVAGAVYAGVIHNGWPARNIKPQPFLAQAVAVTEDQLVDLYADHTDRTVHTVKGK